MSSNARFTELQQFTVDPAAADLLPLPFCLERLVTVVGEVPPGNTPVTVGMVNPNDQTLLGEVREHLGRPFEPIQLNAYEVRKALSRLHGISGGERGISVLLHEGRGIDFNPGRNPSAQLDDLLSVAVRMNATDVHIEVFAEDVDLRFRIDGFLRQITTPLSPENVSRIVSVLKVLCDLDVVERREAQDGHFSALYQDESGRRRRIDFRVSILPGIHGEEAVVRVLDPERFRLDLGDLGIGPVVQERYKRLISYPNGLVLVVGPTVSGKTNTLYASIHHLREQGVKIVTAEDPVEYEFSKISQKSVSSHMSYADYMVAFLRQNPDVMLVGEIRDEETAEAVVQAATTGHLVLSSLHTRSALSAIVRLRTLGVADDYISSILVAILGQRLVGRICTDCKQEVDPPQGLIPLYYESPPEHPFFAGKGCEACDGTGYRGLVGVFELLEMTPALANAVAAGAPGETLYHLAADDDEYDPLIRDALAKVKDGITTLEEVARRLRPVFRPKVLSIPTDD